jgi:hypothetical protein
MHDSDSSRAFPLRQGRAETDLFRPGVAEAAVSFVEAPDFVGETQARAATAYLFEFVYEVPSPVVYRYTNYEKPLVYAGHTYEPQKIEHGNRKQSTNPAKDEMTVTCGEFTDSLGRRNPLWQRVGHGLERRLLLTVYACNPAAPNDSANVYWRGSCGEDTPTGDFGRRSAFLTPDGSIRWPRRRSSRAAATTSFVTNSAIQRARSAPH